MGCDKTWHPVDINDSVEQVNEPVSRTGILSPLISVFNFTWQLK